MKIRITSEIPVGEKDRPEVGKSYDVTRVTNDRRTLYFISVNGREVGIWDHECEVIK